VIGNNKIHFNFDKNFVQYVQTIYISINSVVVAPIFL